LLSLQNNYCWDLRAANAIIFLGSSGATCID